MRDGYDDATYDTTIWRNFRRAGSAVHEQRLPHSHGAAVAQAVVQIETPAADDDNRGTMREVTHLGAPIELRVAHDAAWTAIPEVERHVQPVEVNASDENRRHGDQQRRLGRVAQPQRDDRAFVAAIEMRHALQRGRVDVP